MPYADGVGRTMTHTTSPSARVRSTVFTRPIPVVGGALLAGVGFDLLAFDRPHGPGLAIACLLMTAVVWWTLAMVGGPDRETTAVLTATAAIALVPVWRSATPIVVLSAMLWLALLSVSVRRSRSISVSGWTTGSYVRAAIEAVAALGEPFLLASEDLAGLGRSRTSKLTRILPLVRGLALGTVVVGFFAVLFGSADPIFAQILSDAFDVDFSLERIIRFGTVAGAVAWWTAGMARRAARPGQDHKPVRPSGHGLIESRVILGTLNGLFALFLAVQSEYLFVGAVGRIDLGYAEYARRGFFELVTVAVCVAGLVLTVDWVVSRRDRILDMLHVVLVAQTFAVMASAVVRMKAYTDAFGLSELRFYTSVFMLWTASVLIAMVVTVLRNRRDAFALAAAIWAMCVVVGLVVANPDGLIARVNLDRARSGAELDLAYLEQLSADAVPTVVSRHESASETQAAQTGTLLESWRADLETHAAEHGWRSWSIGDARAARLLAEAAP